MRQTLLAVLLLTLAVPSFAATYYCATTGNDAAAGTEGAPWRSIKVSVAKLADGDTLMVQPGTYTDYNVSPGIRAVPVTVQSVVPRAAIIDGAGSNNAAFGSVSGIPLQKGLRVIGMKLQNFWACGVQTEQSEDWYLENCEITTCQTAAVKVAGPGSNWTLKNCYIHDNSHGLSFGWGAVNGILIEDCVLENNVTLANPNSDGMSIEVACSNVVVRRTTSSGHGDAGLM